MARHTHTTVFVLRALQNIATGRMGAGNRMTPSAPSHPSRLAGLAPAVLAAICSLSGCGSDVELHPASGKVIYPGGAPVPAGSLEWTSIDAQPPRVARSVIEPDGSFRLETVLEQGAAPGALPGKHRVLVRSPLRSERDTNWRATVHTRFGSYDTSGLVLTIEPGGNKNLTIQVLPP